MNEYIEDRYSLRERWVKDAIASVVGNAISQAIRDLVRRLLGDDDHERLSGWRRDPLEAFDRPGYGHGEDRFGDHRYGRFQEDDDPWRQDVQAPLHQRPEPNHEPSRHWGQAVRAAIQAGLWWLRTRPAHHPVLTTIVVALAAGGTTLMAGPTVAAGVSVVAAVASLLITADSVRSLTEMLGILTR